MKAIIVAVACFCSFDLTEAEEAETSAELATKFVDFNSKTAAEVGSYEEFVVREFKLYLSSGAGMKELAAATGNKNLKIKGIHLFERELLDADKSGSPPCTHIKVEILEMVGGKDVVKEIWMIPQGCRRDKRAGWIWTIKDQTFLLLGKPNNPSSEGP